MKLKEFLETIKLPKYENAITKGDYANGNYRGVGISFGEKDSKSLITTGLFRLRNIEEVEQYWNKEVIGITSVLLSCGRNNANTGIVIILDKES